jgi:hypothetical protein
MTTTWTGWTHGRDGSTSTGPSCFVTRCAVTSPRSLQTRTHTRTPSNLSDHEKALAEIADWGPAENWADWADSGRLNRRAPECEHNSGKHASDNR